MKFQKAIATVLCMAVGMSVLCCSCSADNGGSGGYGRNRNSRDDEEEEEYEVPEDEILVVRRSENEAWGHARSITFIMSDGNVYSSSTNFGFGRNQDYSVLSYEDELTLLRKYTEPIGKMDEDKIAKLYNNMMKIDTGADFEYSDEEWDDAGYSDIEVLNSDGEYMKISESGCRQGELEDRNARKALSVIRTFFNFLEVDSVPTCYLPTDTFIDTFECTADITDDAHILITNNEELDEFISLTGVDLRKLEDFSYFGDADYDQFNSVCIAVEIKGYDGYLSLQEISSDAFIVSDSYVGFGIIEDPVIDISDQIVEQKYYCHVAVVPGYDMSVYDPFVW